MSTYKEMCVARAGRWQRTHARTQFSLVECLLQGSILAHPDHEPIQPFDAQTLY